MDGSGTPPAERMPRRYTLPAACCAWAARGADRAPPAHTRTKVRRSIIEWLRSSLSTARSMPKSSGSDPARARGRGQTGASPAEAPVERFVARHDDVGGEELARTGPRGFTEGSPSGWVVDQALQRAGERAGVTGGNEHAAYIVLHDFRDPADARGDTGAAEAHRLQDAQAEALRVGGEEPDVGYLEVLLDVGDLFPDDEPVLELELPHALGVGGKRFPREHEEPEGVAGAEVGGMHDEDFAVHAELAPHLGGGAARWPGNKEVVDDLDGAAEVEHALGLGPERGRHRRD